MELEENYEYNRHIDLSESVRDTWRFVVYKPVKRDIAFYNNTKIEDSTLSQLMHEFQKGEGECAEKLHAIIIRVNRLKLREVGKDSRLP